MTRGPVPPASTAAGRKLDAACSALVFLAVFATYLASAPRAVMLDDDGFFIMAAWFNGVAHPPGYPLYTLLAHAAALVPAGSVALRVHLFSALCGALACVLLWRFARLLLGSRRDASVAALAFGFSATFWSQSIIAEVYALNMLLLFALLLLSEGYVREPRAGDRRPLLIAFVYGLSLANHWPLIGLCTPALAVLLWPRRHALLRQLPALALCVVAGLLPYAWMVVRSRVSEFSFYGPIESWSDFWFYVSRQGYASADHSLTAGWADKGRFAIFALGETARQFGLLGLPFLLAGFVRQWKAWPRRVCVALTLVFVVDTFVLIGLLDFDFDLWHRNIFDVYPLPAFGAAALWLALGLAEAIGWAASLAAGAMRPAVLAYGASALLILSVWAGNAPQNLRASDTWAAEYAFAVLNSLPRDAVLFVSGDYAAGPIGFLHLVGRTRPDLVLMSDTGLVFGNRLFKPIPGPPANSGAIVADFVRASGRRVFYTPSLPFEHRSAFYGLYYEALPPGGDASNRVMPTTSILDYFARMESRGEPRDPSERIHFRSLKLLYCSLLSHLARTPGRTAEPPGPLRDPARACGDFYGLLARAGVALGGPKPDPAATLALLLTAERRSAEAVQRIDLATLYYLTGRGYELSGDRARATASFAKSLTYDPRPENQSNRELRRARARDGAN